MECWAGRRLARIRVAAVGLPAVGFLHRRFTLCSSAPREIGSIHSVPVCRVDSTVWRSAYNAARCVVGRIFMPYQPLEGTDAGLTRLHEICTVVFVMRF